jgi:amidase
MTSRRSRAPGMAPATARALSARVSPLSPGASLAACLLGSALGAGCGPIGAPELPFNPDEASIQDVRSFVKGGIISCRQMINRYQLLHDALDPRVNAIVSWNQNLMEDADRLDRVPRGQRGSFHCVPIVVKDNMDVIGMPTTGGVAALGGMLTRNNAEAVQRLITAGAIVLGKTNMPDFALDGINTMSSFGGQTYNPYNRDRTVYGSSGGTAAAITTSLGIVGLGSDTYGSLVQPASATGLVAIRPTQGLVSGQGILPLMSLQDMPGPMTRTVEDAAAALELMVDKQFLAKGSQSYTTDLSRDGLKGLAIGFDPALLQPLPMPELVPSPEVSELFATTLKNLTTGGASTKQVDALGTLFPSLAAVSDLSFKCMPVDFKQSLNSYLATFRPELPTKSLKDLIATKQYRDSVAMFITGAEAQADTIQTSMDCQQYLAAKTAAASAITALMDKEGLDLLVYPAANQPAFVIGEPPRGWFGFQILSSPTGLPSLTMPMGRAPSGAPVGFILLARGYQEAKLIQAAYAYQTRFKPRAEPPSSP